MIATGADALAFLVELGVSAHLVRHHELVLEAAVELCDGLRRRLGARFDAGAVQIGAALHDAGKIEHPAELSGPGSAHEAAGRELLLAHGLPEHLARFCVTHGDWRAAPHTRSLEDLLVALADKLWKGKRQTELEALVLERLVAQLDLPKWRVFEIADGVFEAVAARGDDRLARSTIATPIDLP
ncbi:HD domain-containing protein [Pseudenhygromyxa sp. WMMC2535]|uniref:HD domain-containing protein n=1 Tax=Pseudenhygromyxa sp. WMMC2535 TaxID=2712867 RepID=UPI001554E6B1|nr:HD domain-containing protein [Pseudenhygromyxa sp. WMMC2535]NVB42757.1 HD domain-containing protein [Pseudenhygromyxa sp. WMMC2535]